MVNNILLKAEVIDRGINFENLWFTSYSDEVIDNPEDEGGKPFTGLAYELYGNGELIYYCFYKDGFKHGDFVKFYTNGNIEMKQYMKYGQTRGVRRIWYENGNLKYIGEFELGICLNYKEWDIKGDLIKEKLAPTEGEIEILGKNRKWYKKLGRD